MSLPLSSITRAARLFRLYGWLSLIGLVAIVSAIALPALHDGHVEPRALVLLAIAAIATTLLFLMGRTLSPRNPKSRYFAGGLCVLLMLFFPIGTVLAAFPLYYLVRGWSETVEPDSTAAAGRSSSASGLSKVTHLLLRLVLWNAGFIVCLAVVAMYADRRISDPVGVSLPYIAGVWLLVLGARFANRRASVFAIAIITSLLLLLQCAIFGFGILMSPYNFPLRTQFQLLLAAVLVTGVAFVWWFITAKLSQLSAQA